MIMRRLSHVHLLLALLVVMLPLLALAPQIGLSLVPMLAVTLAVTVWRRTRAASTGISELPLWRTRRVFRTKRTSRNGDVHMPARPPWRNRRRRMLLLRWVAVRRGARRMVPHRYPGVWQRRRRAIRAG
jgi:hypothetical protein